MVSFMTDMEREEGALAEHDKLVIDWWLTERVAAMYPTHVFTRGEATDGLPLLLVDGKSIGTIPPYEFKDRGYMGYFDIMDGVLIQRYK